MFKAVEIKRITKAKLIQGTCPGPRRKRGIDRTPPPRRGASLTFKGVSIDSRTVKKGDLFIAVKGKRFDGHWFIKRAVERGAAGIMVEKKDRQHFPDKENGACPVFFVKNTIKALGQIARAHRDRFDIPVIAITGSAGKTTTKEILAAILKSRFQILKNAGTENNHIGVPLTLLKLKAKHDAAIVEMGTNRPGDIRWLTCVAHPDIAIFTNIGESHLELLKSPRQVFREKAALVKGMAEKGTVILNKDDSYLRTIFSRRGKKKVITFGIGKGADYRVISLKFNQRCALQFKVKGCSPVTMNTPVVANVYNCLAAISCGRLLGLSYADMAKSIKRFRFTNGRQSVRKVNGCWLIDDTYNANPVSLRSALKTLSSFKIKGRRIFVCADMLELGARSKDLHRSMGELAADFGVNFILAYGKLSKEISRAAHLKNPGISVFHSSRRPDVHKRLLAFCQPGDAILVKGSRGMHMEETINFLERNLIKNRG